MKREFAFRDRKPRSICCTDTVVWTPAGDHAVVVVARAMFAPFPCEWALATTDTRGRGDDTASLSLSYSVTDLRQASLCSGFFALSLYLFLFFSQALRLFSLSHSPTRTLWLFPARHADLPSPPLLRRENYLYVSPKPHTRFRGPCCLKCVLFVVWEKVRQRDSWSWGARIISCVLPLQPNN